MGESLKQRHGTQLVKTQPLLQVGYHGGLHHRAEVVGRLLQYRPAHHASIARTHVVYTTKNPPEIFSCVLLIVLVGAAHIEQGAETASHHSTIRILICTTISSTDPRSEGNCVQGTLGNTMHTAGQLATENVPLGGPSHTRLSRHPDQYLLVVTPALRGHCVTEVI